MKVRSNCGQSNTNGILVNETNEQSKCKAAKYDYKFGFREDVGVDSNQFIAGHVVCNAQKNVISNR